MQCVYSGSAVYSYQRDEVLTGDDALASQGWPALGDEFSSVSQYARKKLAGAGFSLPVATVVSLAYVYSPFGSWWADNSKPH